MHISYQQLWNTFKERGMRKEDLRLAAGLTTNMIANMGKGKHISMETLLRICKIILFKLKKPQRIMVEFIVVHD